MTRIFSKALFAGALALAGLSFIPAMAEAQRRGDRGPGAITFFEQPNYQGRSVRIDGDAPDFRRVQFNDLPSSFRIEGRGYWEICFDINYRGRCEIVSEDTPMLSGGWNNQISSARPVNFRGPGAREGLVMYSEPNFEGQSVLVTGNIGNLNSIQFNDRPRSLEVLSGEWIVCQHANFGGRCETLRNDASDLRRMGLDREISSVSPTSQYNPPAPANPGYGPGSGVGSNLRPGSVFGGTRGAQSTYFADPRVQGAPIARCMSNFGSSGCDQVVADQVCRAEGFGRAAYYTVVDRGRTNHYFLADNRTALSNGAISDLLCVR